MATSVRLMAGALILGLSAVFAACTTAEAPQPGAETAAPAPTSQSAVLSDLLKDWESQIDTMMKIADAMPEDKFGYKSTPPQRSYGEQIMHVALVNVDLLKLLLGKAVAPSFTAETAKTKAEILKALAESYDYGTALLKQETEATIGQAIQDSPSWLGPSTRARIVWTLLVHSMDIYGQMAVYLRLNGIIPPASRGA
jgi:uncharacterized damage-inducible protein DinB